MSITSKGLGQKIIVPFDAECLFSVAASIRRIYGYILRMLNKRQRTSRQVRRPMSLSNGKWGNYFCPSPNVLRRKIYHAKFPIPWLIVRSSMASVSRSPGVRGPKNSSPTPANPGIAGTPRHQSTDGAAMVWVPAAASPWAAQFD